jgi:hypothetical protein
MMTSDLQRSSSSGGSSNNQQQQQRQPRCWRVDEASTDSGDIRLQGIAKEVSA